MMNYRYFDTPIGEMIAVSNDLGICLLEFRDKKDIDAELRKLERDFGEVIEAGQNPHLDLLTQELTAYFMGKLTQFSVAVLTHGTAFQKSVWSSLQTIPYGQTKSYGDIAKVIHNPNSVRAVGAANGNNRIAIIIPCHRVIGTNGKLTGYAGGLWRKEWLLKHEGIL
jgi:O-6-methylguanine DNA methyltransferase